MKRVIRPYESSGVRLRLLAEADLPFTRNWRNESRRWFIDPRFITEDMHAQWYRRYAGKDDDFVFIVEPAGAGSERLGQAAIYNIDWAAKSAEVGRFLVAPEHTGKGYMKVACAGVVRLAFDVLGLGSLHLSVYENNEAAKHIYLACGFKVKQTLVEAHSSLLKMTLAKG